MEQKFQIPGMSKEEIAKWYSTIKPIVHRDGAPCFLRELSKSELTEKSYTWFNQPEDFDSHVNFSQLSILADIKMLHCWGYYGFFKPSVGEVIRQIPKEYLNKVCAFEIVAAPLGMNSIYHTELEAGFHVSVVRLYQAKNNTNKSATPVIHWPSANDKCPIGMEQGDFQKFFELIE